MSNDSTDHAQEIAEAIQDLCGGKDSAERHLMGAGRQPTKQASARRAKLQQALRELAKASDVDFALCYHVQGTASWDMA